MNRSTLLLTLGLALPLAAAAQTKPTQQVTEVTEDLDPKTGKVIRRTTRTTTVPAGSVATPVGTTATADTTPAAPASDAVVSDFFREKTAVSKLSAPELASAYSRFIERVRADRQGWQTTDWTNAANVLSSLNGRYSQLRDSFSLDDKVTIRSQQAEFQALRTARQLSKEVSDKL
ncbi:MAG: hypothetical protein ACRYFK_05605 [Janthinobacterium lividum]